MLSLSLVRRDRVRHRRVVEHPRAARPATGLGARVLILSASVGGGHNAAARVIQSELSQAGHLVEVVDGLALVSPRLDRSFQWSYPRQLRWVPWLCDWQIRLSNRRTVAAAIRKLCATLWSERLLALVEATQPDLVVSTYPLITAVLGSLRSQGKLGCPCAAVVTDYGVHRLWTAPGVDLHLVVSDESRQQVTDVDGQVAVMQPLVNPAYLVLRDRHSARTRLHLPQRGFIALVVGGAWGIGDLETTTAHVAASGVYTVVVCGRNTSLAARLSERFAGNEAVRVLGWTEELPWYMAAADCLVQNAGGITCLEAVAARLPIVLYRPVAGHGRLNACAMERAEAAYWARSARELQALLRAAASGRFQLVPPRVESGLPAAAALLSLLPVPVASVASIAGTGPAVPLNHEPDLYGYSHRSG
jgi:UDP-N-acetylglucosamine:LPS N-acetylglucosamine transferase